MHWLHHMERKNECDDGLEELIHVNYRRFRLHRSKVIMNDGWIRIWKVTLGLILRPCIGSHLDKLKKTKQST
jgi:hypothetical protein